MSNFWQRTLTGIFFVSILAGGIYYHQMSFLILFLLVVIGGIHEMTRLFSQTETKIDFIPTVCLGGVIFISAYLVQSKMASPSLFLVIIPIVCFLFIRELFKRNKYPLLNVAMGLLTACYIAVPFALMNLLAFDKGIYNFHLPLSVFILVWINDTGAYLSGITIGKHKLFERISPKKTWEGTLGDFH